MRKLIPALILTAAALGLTGCFTQAAKDAPLDATLRCVVLVGPNTGSQFTTDKATAVSQGWDQDSNTDVGCDVEQP